MTQVKKKSIHYKNSSETSGTELLVGRDGENASTDYFFNQFCLIVSKQTWLEIIRNVSLQNYLKTFMQM